MLLLLEPIFDADFLDCSYGFRPKRSANGAIEEVQANLRAGYTEVYDADLQVYFDSIPHDKLMKGIETRVSDGSMLRLIRSFLQAPVQDGTKPPTRPGSGTPQGGVISPLLANSFLHWFDLSFFSENGPAKWAKARLIRYADDFVVMARFIDQRIIGFIEEKIERRLGLVINREKTRVLQLNDERATFFLEHRLQDVAHFSFVLADICDMQSLAALMEGVDIVIHAAALKHVGLCERAPRVAIQTNIIGTQHVIQAALAAGVERFLLTSSDKAVNPTNVMGTSKLMA